ncbi:methylenetetrahydrofolate reductase [Lacticaseibacillus absianus]|uniref:methylenetetrahydrofolate reductase n=1 Tax=Lacticaseibacillus absianus TaxID=2729623 RepID=UPI0015CA08D7|nr:methylenetetrahydrofolate reductase [Lacticaseibacillus absianus]
MKVNQLFNEGQVISFEVFPPRLRDPQADLRRIDDTVAAIADLAPGFVSVTFGAGGTTHRAGTLELAARLKDTYGIEPVAHLPAAQLSTPAVDQLLGEFQASGIENLLALRGDIPVGGRVANDFAHASDLIAHIHAFGDFAVAGACYPEGHPESPSVVADIRHLRTKVDSGADWLISQLFFDNQQFYQFQERAACAGITVPISAGVMPVLNLHQIEHMATMNGVTLPPKFTSMMARYADNKAAMRDAGIAYAIDQIVDLLVHGVRGIHIYTMDNPTVARRIVEAVGTLARA